MSNQAPPPAQQEASNPQPKLSPEQIKELKKAKDKQVKNGDIIVK